VLGVGAGALATSASGRRTDEVAPTSTPVANEPAPTAIVDAARLEGPAAVQPEDLPKAAPAASSSNKPAPQAPRGNGGGDLSAERAVLDVARTALGRGDAAHALASTEEHAKRFPRGALSEEREAIAVQALAQSGKPSEARARALRFKKDYPESILLPAVLAAGAVP
jgi:TolA-binding protein